MTKAFEAPVTRQGKDGGLAAALEPTCRRRDGDRRDHEEVRAALAAGQSRPSGKVEDVDRRRSSGVAAPIAEHERLKDDGKTQPRDKESPIHRAHPDFVNAKRRRRAPASQGGARPVGQQGGTDPTARPGANELSAQRAAQARRLRRLAPAHLQLARAA